jgi:nitrate reductase NapE component
MRTALVLVVVVLCVASVSAFEHVYPPRDLNATLAARADVVKVFKPNQNTTLFASSLLLAVLCFLLNNITVLCFLGCYGFIP